MKAVMQSISESYLLESQKESSVKIQYFLLSMYNPLEIRYILSEAFC